MCIFYKLWLRLQFSMAMNETKSIMQQGGYFMVGFNPSSTSLMIKYGNLAENTQEQLDLSVKAVRYLQSTDKLSNNKHLLMEYLTFSLPKR